MVRKRSPVRVRLWAPLAFRANLSFRFIFSFAICSINEMFLSGFLDGADKFCFAIREGAYTGAGVVSSNYRIKEDVK